MQRVLVFALLGAVLGLGCNNGSSSTPGTSTPTQVIQTTGSNVLPVSVNFGPTDETTNFLFASVTICAPGSTTNCQTIGGIQVDTGSTGLRILSSALSLSLPQEADANGNPIVECLQFVDSYSWGSVRTADVQIAGEQAHSVPIQLIGDPAFPSIPDACSSTGPSSDTVESFGANGLLGIGVFRQDCGSPCVFSGVSPPLYYICPSSGAAGCQPTPASLAQQVPNPVWLFSADNNGTIVELPSVVPAGEASVSGSLVFGIGTQSNNALGAANVIPVDANGLFTTVYKGTSYTGSVFDTGTNALEFLDSGTLGIPLCSDAAFFYCPTSTQNLSAAVPNMAAANVPINFSVANADMLFGNASFAAYSNLAGPNPGTFDWGLPFFFGRNVFVAIESQSTSSGVGPYWAF
jgi:Protein of unknown function (DUF3443)